MYTRLSAFTVTRPDTEVIWIRPTSVFLDTQKVLETMSRKAHAPDRFLPFSDESQIQANLDEQLSTIHRYLEETGKNVPSNLYLPLSAIPPLCEIMHIRVAVWLEIDLESAIAACEQAPSSSEADRLHALKGWADTISAPRDAIEAARIARAVSAALGADTMQIHEVATAEYQRRNRNGTPELTQHMKDLVSFVLARPVMFISAFGDAPTTHHLIFNKNAAHYDYLANHDGSAQFGKVPGDGRCLIAAIAEASKGIYLLVSQSNSALIRTYSFS